MYIGKEIQINYDEDNPNKVYYSSIEKMMGIIFTAIGVIAIVSAICVSLSYRKERRGKQKLIDTGEFVMCELVEIRQDKSCLINGRYPIRVNCEYYDSRTGKKHILSREIIMKYIELDRDCKIRAYVDINNPDKYYVDIDSILSQAKILDLRKAIRINETNKRNSRINSNNAVGSKY